MKNFNYDELSRVSGNSFEKWFSDLMKEKYSTSYYQTRSLGRLGDLKVDGVLNNDTCFACYGAENAQNFNQNCAKKFEEDLTGFSQIHKSKWPNIKKWVFVTNSQHENLPASLLSKINTLTKSLELNFECHIWTLVDIDKNVCTIRNKENSGVYELCNKLTSFLMFYKNLRKQLQKNGYELDFSRKLSKEAEIFGLDDHRKVLSEYYNILSDLNSTIHENLFFLRSIGLQSKIENFVDRFQLSLSDDVYFSFYESFEKITKVTLEEEDKFLNDILHEIEKHI